MTHYLIDTENVATKWFQIISSLKPNDTILLFYTDANGMQPIPMSILGQIDHLNATIRAIYCKTGDNALDFQLTTYLGYLIAKYPDEQFIIVSEDTGYDPAIQFWYNQNIKILRHNLQTKSKRKKTQNTELTTNVPPCGNIRDIYTRMLLQVFSPSDPIPRIVNVMMHTMDLPLKGKSLQIQNQMRQSFGQQYGMELYRTAKPIFDNIIKNGPYPR